MLRLLQDLSDEQKVILIRRELSGCSVEEAMNSLEACSGDVDAAVAMLSQVLVCHAVCHPVAISDQS